MDDIELARRPSFSKSESSDFLRIPASGSVKSRYSGQAERANADERSADIDATQPPLGVKLTAYRLLNITAVFSLGLIKGILTYMGQSTAPTTLDWVGGALLVVVLYWIGLYEERDAKKWKWFFRVNLAPGIAYFTKRVVAAALLNGLYIAPVVTCPTCAILLIIYLFNERSAAEGHPTISAFALLGVFLGFMFGLAVFLILLYVGVKALTRRVRARPWAWQRTMHFLDDYGPNTPPLEGYGCLGTVGSLAGTIGCICVSPIIVAFIVIFWVQYI